MARSDVHRPSAIVPADYEYVAPDCIKVESLSDVPTLQFYREQIKRHMERTGGSYSRHAHGGNCMVCGNANAIYTILFYHAKSNSYVRMGERCAQEVDARFDEVAAKGLRRAVAEAHERKAGRQKAQAVLADAGLSAAWDVSEPLEQQRTEYRNANERWQIASQAHFDAHPDGPEYDVPAPVWPRVLDQFEERTVADIVSKLVRYGSISEKQQSFLRSLLEKIAQRPAREAQRAAESEAAAPCPTGRVVVEGEVLTVKAQDGYAYGSTVLKVLVKADAGWKVWGTLPASIEGAVRGSRVRFVAAVEPSNDDPKFGFFKRPTKAELLS